MLSTPLTGAAILVTKTVGAKSSECASRDVITVNAGESVFYCYMVQNIGTVTLTYHTVVDDKIGTVHHTILLPPGQCAGGLPGAVAYFTAAVPIDTTTFNTVTWTASNDVGDTVTATDVALVRVPTIVVSHTVDATGTGCPSSHAVNVVAGTELIHCYTVRNTGPVTLTVHDAVDSRLGMIQENLQQVLSPDATIVLTAADIATETNSSILTWTARVSGTLQVTDTLFAQASDAATIRVPAVYATTTVGQDNGLCATTTVISVTVGTDVTYCYTILNTGGVTHTLLDVSDTLPGPIYKNLSFTLAADVSTLFTVDALITSTQINTVTWFAHGYEHFTATATSSATVHALSRLEVAAYYDVTPGGAREPLEAPVPGITVTILMPSGEMRTQVTKQQGVAVFEELPPGEYRLSVELIGDYALHTNAQLGPLNMTAPNFYTSTLPLNRPPETDSDGDGIPDYIEGADDNDFDGIPNYLDSTQMLYLALIVR